MKRSHSALRNQSWRNPGGSPCLPAASVGLQVCAGFEGGFSWGNATASMGHIVSFGLGELAAGASLLVTCLHFPTINCVTGCVLTKLSDNVKGCLSPEEDHVWSCGGVSHSHQESVFKNHHYRRNRLDPDLIGKSTSCTASSCCWSGWLVPLHCGSHLPLALPHRHVLPSATPTGKPQDQKGSK